MASCETELILRQQILLKILLFELRLDQPKRLSSHREIGIRISDVIVIGVGGHRPLILFGPVGNYQKH
jgi:hypothetical protein